MSRDPPSLSTIKCRYCKQEIEKSLIKDHSLKCTKKKTKPPTPAAATATATARATTKNQAAKSTAPIYKVIQEYDESELESFRDLAHVLKIKYGDELEIIELNCSEGWSRALDRAGNEGVIFTEYISLKG